MSVVYIALPVTMLIAAGFVVAFVIAVRRGQFDDLDTPAYRVLFDDDEKPERSGASAPPAGDADDPRAGEQCN